MILRLFMAIAITFGLAACATTDRTVGASPDVQVAQLESLPTPTSAGVYRVRPQETLDVVVSGSEMLSGAFLVDAEGYLKFPLTGEVYVAGKTPVEVSQAIANSLRGRVLVDPQVRVAPKEPVALSVSVGGEVKRPGTYAAASSTSLLRAINDAGGLAEYAKSDDVLIMRTVEGQNYIGVYNIAAIQRGNYADPILYANDIVMVGDSPGRRRLARILQFFPLLTSSLILFDQVQN